MLLGLTDCCVNQSPVVTVTIIMHKMLSPVLLVVIATAAFASPEKSLEFVITKEWESSDIDHNPIHIKFVRENQGKNKAVRFIVDAPFFNDPDAPDGPPGESFNKLWNYEVVEAFFLADDEKYLEVELCPHGQHLNLLLDGTRNAIKIGLAMQFHSTIKGDHWHGEAIIPEEYFPPRVTKFNAYAIHGSGLNRTYESLYPTPNGLFIFPDFHRLDYFQEIDFKVVLPTNQSPLLSSVWKEALSTN